jgi:hypothetical protein
MRKNDWMLGLYIESPLLQSFAWGGVPVLVRIYLRQSARSNKIPKIRTSTETE